MLKFDKAYDMMAYWIAVMRDELTPEDVAAYDAAYAAEYRRWNVDSSSIYAEEAAERAARSAAYTSYRDRHPEIPVPSRAAWFAEAFSAA